MPDSVKTESVVQKFQTPPSIPVRECKAIKCDEKDFIQLGVKVLESGAVVPDESNVIDLDALIQTYKDSCGMEAAQRLLKLGQKTLADFADPCVEVDATKFPATAQEAANAAVKAEKKLEAFKKEFGLVGLPNEITGDQLEQLLNAYFSKHPEYIKQQEVKKDAE